MPNKEKVIKGLNQHCEGSMFDRCGECPYYEFADEPFQCRDELLRDVIAMLKEQETVDKNTGEWKNGHCSCCGEDVSSMLNTWTNVQKFRFCPNCGAKMEE